MKTLTEYYIAQGMISEQPNKDLSIPSAVLSRKQDREIKRSQTIKLIKERKENEQQRTD